MTSSSDDIDAIPSETPADEPGFPTLADAVQVALDKTGHTCLKQVLVTTSGGHVLLRGPVPSYYLKQLAQTIVMALAGVECVRNELLVDSQ